jgi:hypothetical protein
MPPIEILVGQQKLIQVAMKELQHNEHEIVCWLFNYVTRR